MTSRCCTPCTLSIDSFCDLDSHGYVVLNGGSRMRNALAMLDYSFFSQIPRDVIDTSPVHGACRSLPGFNGKLLFGIRAASHKCVPQRYVAAISRPRGNSPTAAGARQAAVIDAAMMIRYTIRNERRTSTGLALVECRAAFGDPFWSRRHVGRVPRDVTGSGGVSKLYETQYETQTVNAALKCCLGCAEDCAESA